jgi:hypothetical protein
MRILMTFTSGLRIASLWLGLIFTAWGIAAANAGGAPALEPREEVVEFTLRLRNYDELCRRVERGEILTLNELDRYFPTVADWEMVAAWARSRDVAVSPADRTRMTVSARMNSGRSSTFWNGRGVREIRALSSGETRSEAVPAELSGVVSHVRRAIALPREAPHEMVAEPGFPYPYVLPSSVAELYHARALGLDGREEEIIVPGGAPINREELAKFWTLAGLPVEQERYVPVHIPNPGMGYAPTTIGEVSTIQLASAIAPKARILHFDTVAFPQIGAWIAARLAAGQRAPGQLCYNWVLAEATYTNIDIRPNDEEAITVIAAMGTSIFVPSGNVGTHQNVVRAGVSTFGFHRGGTLTLEHPGGHPAVTSVGGTRVQFRDYMWGRPFVEAGWCLQPPPYEGIWASTGGLSRLYARPNWQVATGLTPGPMRASPDISAFAFSNEGMPLAYFRGVEHGVGAAGPALWASFSALINQARRENGLPPVGQLAPHLYELQGTDVFNSLNPGYYTGNGFEGIGSNGEYFMTPGYNLVVGLGSVNVARLLDRLLANAPASPPIVVEQPQGKYVMAGEVVFLRTAARAQPSATYQWYRDGEPLAGETRGQLAIPMSSAHAVFKVLATNSSGSAWSDEAIVETAPPLPHFFYDVAYLENNPTVAAELMRLGNVHNRAWFHYFTTGIHQGLTDGDFEVEAYLERFPELQTLEAAALHWYTTGRRDGVLIPKGFDANGYIQRYEGLNIQFLRLGGIDKYAAWLYYRDHGIQLGHVFDEEFRVNEYLALNPDLGTAFKQNVRGALLHWLSTGRAEGRLGRIPVEFDAQQYLARNPDLAASFNGNALGAWRHYWEYGIYEGRAFDEEFRVFDYLAINQDLLALYQQDWRAAAMHWLRYGRVEGRLGRIPAIFNSAEYLNRYPAVGAAWGTYPTTIWQHYWLYGVDEGRNFDEEFRVDDYMALNPDLAQAFGENRRAAFMHWVRYGRTEGRPARN